MNKTIIKLQGISKAFTIHTRSDATILSRMADMIPSENKRHTVRKLQALSDISLDVKKGEVLGIIGRNASGKSTLMRIIAGILDADSGKREVHGNITSVMNLGVGLRHRLTIRDNIFFACSLYGMRHSDIRKAIPDIIEFAGIEDCLDMYPYQLSSGMSQRMSFSIAIHTNPEILLLDEVFSAGDIAFQKRAIERMTTLIKSNVTVVIVSHSLDRIEELCDHVIWLDEGRILLEGPPSAVLQNFTETLTGMCALP
jgi:lipopolysaccharide transport system ATP-binding protein